MSGFYLDIYNPAGERQAVLSTEVLSLNYQNRVNHPGKVVFETSADRGGVSSQIQIGWRCDVWRKLPSGVWRKEMVSFVDGEEWRFTDRPTSIYGGSGPLSLLGKRRVAWSSNVANRSLFEGAKAETVAKTLVSYNAGSNATTANGRKLGGINSLITVEADGARGNAVEWSCPWANLLETLQELAKVGGGDFDLVPSGDGFEFKWFPGQLGTDRTATIVFSLERGNMANPRHTLNAGKFANSVIVGGKGEDNERHVVVVEVAGHSAATHSEEFLDATDIETEEGLTQRGEGRLDELKIASAFSFDIIQSRYTSFNVDYFLGDLVKVINPKDGTAKTVKIDSVAVSFGDDGRETIRVGVA